MLLVDQEIENINNLICKNIKRSKSSSRGEISQIIISQLRNLVEAIMVKIDANGANVENSYEKIKLARKNPVHFLCKSSSEFFYLDGDAIDFRTKEYYKNRFENK